MKIVMKKLQKKNINLVTICLIVAIFILFTILHCLYYESFYDECSLGFLGVHRIVNSNSNLLEIIFLSFYSASILIFYNYSVVYRRLMKKYFLIIKFYIGRMLFYCHNTKLFDQLRLAYTQGIINSKIYPTER